MRRDIRGCSRLYFRKDPVANAGDRHSFTNRSWDLVSSWLSTAWMMQGMNQWGPYNNETLRRGNARGRGQGAKRRGGVRDDELKERV